MATARDIVRAHYEQLNAQTIDGIRPENVAKDRAEEAAAKAKLALLTVSDETREAFEAELDALCKKYRIVIEHCDSETLDIRHEL